MVYLATDISDYLQRDYAIKVMNLEPPAGDPENRLNVYMVSKRLWLFGAVLFTALFSPGRVKIVYNE